MCGAGKKPDAPSRSAKKRESAAMQKLGEELCRLAPEERDGLGLSQDLLEALKTHDRIKDREAARRQRQFIGKLMREEDIGALAAGLASLKNVRAEEVKKFKEAEEWRENFLSASASALPSLIEKFASDTRCDRDVLRSLVDKAREDQSGPDATAARRAFFRELSRIIK